jgi:hypothetical protein
MKEREKNWIGVFEGVDRMSDMKHYIGKYCYTGKYKQQDDGSSLLEVSEFALLYHYRNR